MSQNTTTTKTHTVGVADKVIDGGTFHMNWATGKLERCQDHPELPKGTIIHAYGAFMSYSRWAMTGNGQECVKLSENDADTYFSHPFHTLDRYAEPVAKKFGIGFYYDLDATPATDEEISAAIDRANAFLKEQEDAKEEARRAWEQGVADVRQQYAGIFEEKPEGGCCYDAAHVAKNVRKDLAMSFPGFRFSVRKSTYGEIRISWTDGPTEDEVKAVAGKHKEIAERDRWNDDLWDHKPTYFTAVFGGVEYIWYDRTISDERADAMASEIEGVCPGTAGEGFHRTKMDEIPGAWEMYHRYDLNGCEMYWFNSRSVARVVLSRMSFYQAPEKKEAPAKKPATKKEGAGLQVVDYSEKAIAVTGDTRSISDELKALGGRFNPRLSCGAGWIFSKRKEQEVREALGL